MKIQSSDLEGDHRVTRMKELYTISTKHSHYQIMPTFLQGVLDSAALNKRYSRYERERMEFFKEHISFNGKRVLDIGANTGFFSFEALDSGASEVVALEGNHAHAEFIRVAAEIYHKRVQVIEDYLPFNGPLIGGNYDVVLLLNVLHHVGDDFGERPIDVEHAKARIIANLNYFADKTAFMIFQIGFSWMTDYSKPLFANGTKSEMIEMICRGIEGVWDIVAIGIAEVDVDGNTRYRERTDANVPRNNDIGEFRNRPLFILRSKASA